jgi:acetolactate synthase-1/2/3 large subunit
MSKIKVSDFISNQIVKQGIKTVPVFQGGAIFHIIDSIGRNKKLKYYCPYHEQSLAMGIDAYSRIAGFGIGCVTSGPGATNLITGVCCSYYDSIPNLFFTGQVGQFHIKKNSDHRQRGFQETDVAELFSSITKFSYQIKDPNEIGYIIDKAIYIAKSGRPGPVVLDVPYNIQTSYIDPQKIKKFIPNKNILKKNTKKKITNLLKSLTSEKKIVIIAGGGIRISDNILNFSKFIKKNNIPFVTSWASQDITKYDEKLYFGSVGRHGNQCANEIISAADLVITLGFRFAPKAINENFGKNPKIKIVSIDIDQRELKDSIVKTDIKINADLNVFFKLCKQLKVNKYKNLNWIKYCTEKKQEKFTNNWILKEKKNNKVNPYYFFHKLSDLVKKDSIIFTDAGANLCWCMLSYRIKGNQRLISAWGNSPMGYSISAGIGARYAEKNKQIISIIGDGSFMINVQDLQFLKHHKSNLKIIVIDNESLGNTRLGTKSTFNGRTFGNEKKNGYYPPDIKKISNAFSINYLKIEKDSEIERTVKYFLNTKKTTLLHVKVLPEIDVIDHSQNLLQSCYKF